MNKNKQNKNEKIYITMDVINIKEDIKTNLGQEI